MSYSLLQINSQDLSNQISLKTDENDVPLEFKIEILYSSAVRGKNQLI